MDMESRLLDLTRRVENLAAELEGLVHEPDPGNHGNHGNPGDPGFTEGQPGRFVKFEEDKRLVYAEVYAPNRVDTHGHYMTADEIEKMAHSFMANARTTQIDVNHDHNTSYGCYMVESFIARAGDPDYTPGAWVAVVFVGDDAVWESIKNGALTGFSFEGMGFSVTEDEREWKTLRDSDGKMHDTA